MVEIVNKVKKSGLINLDLAKFQIQERIEIIDIADQLWNGLVLKEKDFRAWIKENDWQQYEGKSVLVHCSADAIVPTWAYMLVTSSLHSYAKMIHVGTKVELEKMLVRSIIQKLDLEPLKEGRVIIKGCSDHPYPDFAMACLVDHLQQTVKSIMYGEPCSTVPIFKRK